MPYRYKGCRAARGIVCAIALLATALHTSSGAAKLRSDFDLGAQWRVNSTARLIAGLAPMYPAHLEFARTDAWKEHAKTMQAAWAKVSAGRIAAMLAWRDAAISPACPLGKTLLYPFSGPDFFNAWWLFPDCETFVMFGLEHIGEVPDIESINTRRQLARLFGDVRTATRDFFDRNYFITENMARQLHTAQLRGVVPLVMISMALAGVDILRLVPFRFARDEALKAVGATATGRGPALRQLKGITIEFRAPGSSAVRRLHYFTVDATDKGLARYPEFLAFLRTLGATTTFLKSASYLLHGREFRQLREVLLDVSGYLVQDDSGLPYTLLAARGWQLRLHGRYDVPIPPFERAFQAALYDAYRAQAPVPLPFTFGYQYHDYRDERSNVMVGRGPVPPGHAGVTQADKPIVLRTAR